MSFTNLLTYPTLFSWSIKPPDRILTRIKGNQTLDHDVCLKAKIKTNIWATSIVEISHQFY
jgi:hypothetical protein